MRTSKTVFKNEFGEEFTASQINEIFNSIERNGFYPAGFTAEDGKRFEEAFPKEGSEYERLEVINYVRFNRHEIFNEYDRAFLLKIIEECDYEIIKNQLYGMFDGYLYDGLESKVKSNFDGYLNGRFEQLVSKIKAHNLKTKSTKCTLCVLPEKTTEAGKEYKTIVPALTPTRYK